ncbi:MAG: hypothetical protein ACRDYC_06260 [Acidimicrobiales bacterium]
MGMFETAVYSVGAWSDSASGDVWLRVDIHDGSIATIDYSPAEPPRGRLYLGYEPWDYFEDPDDGEPLDREAEAEAFARWAGAHLDQDVSAASIIALMADPDADDPVDDFVEDTVVRLLTLIDVPLPSFLEGREAPGESPPEPPGGAHTHLGPREADPPDSE